MKVVNVRQSKLSRSTAKNWSPPPSPLSISKWTKWILNKCKNNLAFEYSVFEYSVYFRVEADLWILPAGCLFLLFLLPLPLLRLLLLLLWFLLGAHRLLWVRGPFALHVEAAGRQGSRQVLLAAQTKLRTQHTPSPSQHPNTSCPFSPSRLPSTQQKSLRLLLHFSALPFSLSLCHFRLVYTVSQSLSLTLTLSIGVSLQSFWAVTC